MAVKRKRESQSADVVSGSQKWEEGSLPLGVVVQVFPAHTPLIEKQRLADLGAQMLPAAGLLGVHYEKSDDVEIRSRVVETVIG
jgi:hypothetical protein